MTEYLIVGDVEICGKIKECLIKVVMQDFDEAKKMLEEVKQNERYQNHKNIRIQTSDGKDCWWHDPILAN